MDRSSSKGITVRGADLAFAMKYSNLAAAASLLVVCSSVATLIGSTR
jgi:hypothetical protein